MEIEQPETKTQVIPLQGSDDQNVYALTENDIVLSPSSASLNARDGSNKISVNVIVKFDSDTRYYAGNLIAAHHNHPLFAVALHRQGSSSSTQPGLVRVRNLKDDCTTLLRGFGGHVLDLSFSHVEAETLLAVIDELGTLFVFRIEVRNQMGKKEMQQTLILQVVRDTSAVPKASGTKVRSSAEDAQAQPSTETYGRVLWTHFIPDDEEDGSEQERSAQSEERQAETENARRTLLVTFNEHCVFLDVMRLAKLYETRCENAAGNVVEAALRFSELTRFAVTADCHSRPITDAQISPDGSAIATASLDGYVRFYNVSIGDLDSNEDPDAAHNVKQPLHTWPPHEKRPVTALRFLDNYRDSTQSIWRYALTAAENGRELKLWLCTKWQCLQTIRFVEAPETPVRMSVALKLAVDESAQLLMVTDVRRRVLYVLHLTYESGALPAVTNGKQPASESDAGDEIDDASIKGARFAQIAEFVLSTPCLSFALLKTPTPPADVGGAAQQTEINLISIHPRLVQQMTVRYRRPPLLSPVKSPVTNKSGEFNRLNDTFGIGDKATIPDAAPAAASSDDEPTAVDADSPRDAVETELIGPDAFQPAASLDTSSSNNTHESTALEQPPKVLAASADLLASSLATDSAAASVSINPTAHDAHATPSFVRLTSGTTTSATSTMPHPFAQPSVPFVSASNASPAVQQSGTILGLPVGTVSGSTLTQSQPQLQPAVNAQAYATLQNDVRRLNDIVTQLAQAVQTHQKFVETQLTRLNTPPVLANGGTQQGAPITAADLKTLLEKQETSITSRFDRELRHVHAAIEQTANKVNQGAVQQSAMLTEPQLIALREVARHATAECLTAAQNDLRCALDAIHKDGTAQLSTISSKFDAALQQELTKWLASKSTCTQVSQTVATALRNEALAALTDSFERVALPAFQRSADALFAQLNEAFQRGVAEWLAHVATVGNASNVRLTEAFDRTARDALERLERDATRSLVDASRTAINAALMGGTTQTPDGTSGSLADTMAQMVVTRLKPELATQLNDSLVGAFGRTRAQTPSAAAGGKKPCDTARLTQLVAERMYNEAFQEALSASSLTYVLHVCEQVRPTELFASQPCPLLQPVLLSLVQQLSVALDASTPKQLGMRVEYLQSALTCLDTSNAAVREYIPRVAQGVLKSVDVCLSKGTFNEFAMSLRTLRMIANSLSQTK